VGRVYSQSRSVSCPRYVDHHLCVHPLAFRHHVSYRNAPVSPRPGTAMWPIRAPVCGQVNFFDELPRRCFNPGARGGKGIPPLPSSLLTERNFLPSLVSGVKPAPPPPRFLFRLFFCHLSLHPSASFPQCELSLPGGPFPEPLTDDFGESPICTHFACGTPILAVLAGSPPEE